MYSGLSGYNSVPLLHAVGRGVFADRLVYLLATNLVYECLLGVTLPGMLNLAFLALLIKYMLLGVILPLVAFSSASLAAAIMPVVLLEAVGFSMAAAASGRVGVAWLRPARLYGQGIRRRDALRRALRELPCLLLSALAVLVFSSLLETVLSYAAESLPRLLI